MNTESATVQLASRSARDTERAGERLGRVLQPGDFIGLSGELGAGKTAFARGVARGAGVPREARVSSPSFALVNVYAGGRLPVLHADLYRVRDAEELYDAGYFDPVPGAALVVEWIDRVPEAAPADRLEVRLERLPPGRILSLLATGPSSSALLGRFAAAATPR